MKCLKYFLCILASVCLSDGVRINMKGSVSLGKDVIETLSHFMHKNAVVGLGPSRRAMVLPVNPFADKGTEQIRWAILTSNLDRDIPACKGAIGEFLKDYLIFLANAIESIFDGILTLNDVDKENEGAIFIDQIKPAIKDVKIILKRANDILLEDKQKWLLILKLISSKFQKYAMLFVDERLDGDPQDIVSVKKKLGQKLVIAIILVENKYETKLCSDFSICEKDHEATKALHSLLKEFEDVDNKKAMDFVKTFYENLPVQSFKYLNADTLHEFQYILSDLSYSNSAPTRAVLLSVFKTVEARRQYLENLEEISKAYDQQLVNIILSDLDTVYSSKRKTYPFEKFLELFTDWIKRGGKFSSQIRKIMKDIMEKLGHQPEELTYKLANEVRVFLELTVDPEK